MRRSLISADSPLWAKSLGVAALVFVVPLFVVAKLIIMPFEKPMVRSAREVARYLRDFVEGAGGDWDWDDFISIPIADKRLNDIRIRAAALHFPMVDSSTAALKALTLEAEALIAIDHSVA